MSDAYGTQKWKHFRSVEVIVGLVELYRTCVSRSLRSAWKKRCRDAKPPSRKEESRRVYNCDDERLSGSTKPWILKSMWNISSSRHRIFKIHLSFTHRSVTSGDISTPRNVTLNKTNCDWFVDMSVKRPHGRDLAQWKLPWILDLQPSVWRSGYARLSFFVHIFLV